MWAIQQIHLPKVKEMSEVKVDIVEEDDWTLVHRAAFQGDQETIMDLVDSEEFEQV